MAAQEGHQVGDTFTISIEIIPRIIEEMDRIDRITKRLSLNTDDKCCDKCSQRFSIYCDKCGQKLPVPSRSSFPNSFQSLKTHTHGEEPACDEVKEVAVKEEEGEERKPRRGLRFWLIILAVTMVGTVSALEATIVGNALPTIVQELGGAEWYIWTVNAYFLTRFDGLSD